MKMQCPCGRVLDVNEPILEIVNQLTLTMLVFNHANITGNSCVCGSVYVPVIQGIQPELIAQALKFGMRKVEPPKEQSRIITPGGKGFQA